jgi:predicted nucleic acid-binding protein
MFDLTKYSVRVDLPYQQADDWFKPVLNRGRDAVFIDTSFLKGLIDYTDQYTTPARLHFASAKANFYTTNLVLAETVRQIAKTGGIDWVTKTRRFSRCDDLLIDTERVFVCTPPREVILEAYGELKEARSWSQSLDLCDILSVTVLNYAHHRRVFGFDNDFKQFGAMLEP